MSVKLQVEQFVEAFNSPGSNVYPFFGERVDWIEMPSGRRGGRDELFAALRQSRTYFVDLYMDVLSITVDETEAVIESELMLKPASGSNIVRARTIWILGFKDGKIVKEHDYSFVLKQAEGAVA